MEWMCSWCGAPHEENDPPCAHCGHGQFERSSVRRSAAAEAEATATTQWVCTECGRGHPKHAPPCSRCGNMDLEQRTVEVDPAELSSGSVLDLASPGYLALFAVAVLGAGVLGLGAFGVVDVPGLGGGAATAGPDVPTAPGNATAVGGTSLSTVEEDYLATIRSERADTGSGGLRRTDDLDRIATYYTRWWVRAEYRNAGVPMEDVRRHLSEACSGDVTLDRFQVLPTAYEPSRLSGVTIAERTVVQGAGAGTARGDVTGLDVHAGPDGRLFVTQVVC